MKANGEKGYGESGVEYKYEQVIDINDIREFEPK